MSEKYEMHLEYIRHHHWGLFINGELYQEYNNFDEAADEYEARGGTYPDEG